MIETSLDMLPLKHKGMVKRVLDSSIKRRLLDIGLTNGTEVEKVMINYSKNLQAYYIRGALIAIRNEDAKSVVIEVN